MGQPPQPRQPPPEYKVMTEGQLREEWAVQLAYFSDAVLGLKSPELSTEKKAEAEEQLKESHFRMLAIQWEMGFRRVGQIHSN